MSTLAGPGYWLTAWVIHRGIALTYCLAYLNVINQFRPLLGEDGLLPVPRFLRTTTFRHSPSLFHWKYSDRLAKGVGFIGLGLSLVSLAGLTDQSVVLSVVVWSLLWAMYLSVVNVGQIFYGFGWESLLLEAGFLAIFLAPSCVAPSILVIYLFRWLAFRVEFGAGLIKIRGDECWRNLTCLTFHHETQPMPNPLSRTFHLLPRLIHRIEAGGNHFVQLIVPFGLFFPQPVPSIAAALMITTQLWLMLSGNFAWLNLLTIVVATSGLDGALLHHLIPLQAQPYASADWFVVASIILTAAVAFMSRRPVLNLISRNQMMNVSFNNWHLVNSYGAFGSVTRIRQEVVVECTGDSAITADSVWQEYEFKGKPTALNRRPRQYAPYHLRLDWLMWFAALSPAYTNGWYESLVAHLLRGDPAIHKLLRSVPIAKPTYVRAKLYIYRFTLPEERKATGNWWTRDYIGAYSQRATRNSPQKRPGPTGSYGSPWESQPTYESSLQPPEPWGKDPWTDL